jgi:hypothetical protein
MKVKLFYVFLPLMLVLAGCKNGADSIPELSTLIFKALKAQKLKMLETCEPSKNEMEKAFELYLFDSSHSIAARKSEAVNKTAAWKQTLEREFYEVLREGKIMNIDWKQTEVKDFKYTLSDHPQDYKDANVRVIIVTGKMKNVILYKAYLFGNRWYLVEGLRWEE